MGYPVLRVTIRLFARRARWISSLVQPSACNVNPMSILAAMRAKAAVLIAWSVTAHNNVQSVLSVLSSNQMALAVVAPATSSMR